MRHTHKTISKISFNYFCACYLLLVMMLALMCDMPSETPLEKLFFCLKWLMIKRSLLVGMGACVYFPISVLGLCLVWTCPGPIMLSQSLWVHMSISLLCLEDTVSLVSPSPLTLKSSPLTLLEHWGEGSDEDIPFKTECCKISHSLNIVQVLVLYQSVPNFSRRKLPC